MDKEKTEEAKPTRKIIKQKAHAKEWQRIKNVTKPTKEGKLPTWR